MRPFRMTMVALSITWPGAVTTRAPTRAWNPVLLSRMPVTGSVRVACWAWSPLATSRVRQRLERNALTKSPIRMKE